MDSTVSLEVNNSPYNNNIMENKTNLVFINNLILLPNMRTLVSEKPREPKDYIESSKDIHTFIYSLKDTNLSRKLRGRNWNAVTLVGIRVPMLRNEYPDVYIALQNGCYTLNTKIIEV